MKYYSIFRGWFMKIGLDFNDVTREIRDGKKGIGGIGSNGRMTVM